MVGLVQRQALLVGLAVTMLLSPGCSKQRTVTVGGSVVRNGQPITCSPTGYVQVMLIPDLDASQDYTTRQARCEKDGSFKIVEIPPGKYKIGVEQWDPNPQTDKLQGAFRAGDSKIVRDIDGKSPLNIDIGKPNLGL